MLQKSFSIRFFCVPSTLVVFQIDQELIWNNFQHCLEPVSSLMHGFLRFRTMLICFQSHLKQPHLAKNTMFSIGRLQEQTAQYHSRNYWPTTDNSKYISPACQDPSLIIITCVPTQPAGELLGFCCCSLKLCPVQVFYGCNSSSALWGNKLLLATGKDLIALLWQMHKC